MRIPFFSCSFVIFAFPILSSFAEDDLRAPVSAGYSHRFESDIDGGGSVSSHFFHARVGAPLFRDENGLIALSAAYHLNAYDFATEPSSSLTSISPWSDVHTIRVSTPVRWNFGQDWTLFALPNIRFTGEDGANFEDGISGGALAGFSYRFSDRLTLGPGIGILTQLEDDPSIFPIVLIDWKLTDSLSLTTGPSVGATVGPGLSLKWKISDRLTFTTGARYEKLRFRLDESSAAAPGGIGEDRGVPLFGALTYQLDNVGISLLGGLSVGNQLTLEDRGGAELSSRDYDNSPFVGINVSVRF